jgi:hypothetical protein
MHIDRKAVTGLQIFYARIPRTVDEAALTEVFSKAGKVSELILFKINKEANTSKVSKAPPPSSWPHAAHISA